MQHFQIFSVYDIIRKKATKSHSGLFDLQSKKNPQIWCYSNLMTQFPPREGAVQNTLRFNPRGAALAGVFSFGE